jgi:hypothetical protein
MIITKLYVVEYSQSQKAFHVERILDMLSHNLTHVLNGEKTDFVPIGLFASYSEAVTFVQEARPKFENLQPNAAMVCHPY